MKKILISTLIATFSACTVPVYAQKTQSIDCTSIAELAGAVMGARQAGVPMDKMYNLPSDDAAVQRLARILITGAFEIPMMMTKSNKERVTTDFRNQAFAACLKSHKGVGS